MIIQRTLDEGASGGGRGDTMEASIPLEAENHIARKADSVDRTGNFSGLIQ
ncbi:MAG: hypothetical protein WAW42_18795 [Candidatus Competibacteraceae bacterium]